MSEDNKNEKKLGSKKLTKGLIIIIVLILGYIGFSKNQAYEDQELGVAEDNPMLEYFKEEYPNNQVQKAGLGDVNNNGREDLIVIYERSQGDGNEMRVVFDLGDGYKISNEHRAPFENQRIEIRDIDGTPPNEFVITGSRNGRYGYSIYRFKDNYEVHSIFGKDMDVCW